MLSTHLPIDELRRRLAPATAPPLAGSARTAIYCELLGFVPPCEAACDSSALEPLLQRMHEQSRINGLVPPGFDDRTAHLMLIGVLLMQLGANACAQGVAARRAGASWEDLRSVVGLAFLLHGLPAANRGDELLAAIADQEHKDRVSGAVAAYG